MADPRVAPAADPALIRLGRALHDLAAAIDTVEHAASHLDPDPFRVDVDLTMSDFRLRVADLQRDLEFLR